MPRRKILRKINNPPHFKGFMPLGLEHPGRPVLLGFEEYEAIRLCDYEGYHHSVAAGIMQVSRPTFARIYEEARHKVALAFVAGSPLLFQGGRVYYDSDWFECRRCRCRFSRMDKNDAGVKCGLCGSTDVFSLEGAPQDKTGPGTIPVQDAQDIQDVQAGLGMGRGSGRGAGYAVCQGSGCGAGRGRRHRHGGGGDSGHLCRCLNCGYEIQVPLGIPCNQQVCIKCGAPMHHPPSMEPQ